MIRSAEHLKKNDYLNELDGLEQLIMSKKIAKQLGIHAAEIASMASAFQVV